ncbi:hypothetical protein [Rubrivivax gelatinosus]|uniref:Tat pathway signal protein n=1 Tax=Rubrivivax gelatinosus TaxID=28068 RepID=A0ABS1E1F9_RUBGE|nr:hypothetical protein [Rubrivivax gelatinosus]MBK1715705.1 hypothetical protein [Rubrivivax gelatinosus]
MNDTQHPAASPDPAAEKTAPDAAGFSSRRRRLLKIASGAAPASLLLVGRPVHATYNCVSTSAWGSAMASASASTSSSRVTQIDGWSLAHWCSNTAYANFGAPWDKLCSAPGKYQHKVSKARTDMTVGESGVATPSGLLPNVNLGEALAGTCKGSTEFTRNLLVALLNQKLLYTSSLSPTRCTPAPDVNQMASGSYRLTSGKSWGKSEINDYVKKNYLSRPN